MVVVGSGCGGTVTGGGHSIFVQTGGPPPLQVQVLQLCCQDSPSSLSTPFMSTQTGLAVMVEEDTGGAAVVVITLDYNSLVNCIETITLSQLHLNMLFFLVHAGLSLL